MKWSVIWKDEAVTHAVELWLNSNQKLALSAAVETVTELLQQNPLEMGESRQGLRRLVFEWPIALIYEVIPDDLVVKIINVWEP